MKHLAVIEPAMHERKIVPGQMAEADLARIEWFVHRVPRKGRDSATGDTGILDLQYGRPNSSTDNAEKSPQQRIHGEPCPVTGPVQLPRTAPAHPSLETRLNELLRDSPAVTIATAESCTGGEVAHRITSVAGSSDYFIGGVVAYANSAKKRLLGVPDGVLESVGAVSGACAIAMAEGVRRALGADIAVSTTGIAGPGGATARKPVGLVHIGLSTLDGSRQEEHHFPGDRRAVVEAAAERALELLVEAVERELRAGGHQNSANEL